MSPIDLLDVSIHDNRIAVKETIARLAVKRASVKHTEEVQALLYTDLESDRPFGVNEVIAVTARQHPDAAAAAAMERPEAVRNLVDAFISLPSTRVS